MCDTTAVHQVSVMVHSLFTPGTSGYRSGPFSSLSTWRVVQECVPKRYVAEQLPIVWLLRHVRQDNHGVPSLPVTRDRRPANRA